ncbi:MAG: tryptophan synthase subunit alpha [Nanoarchaeota archaeon]|nr:tryptophan synthase subunit alpha [Nanoarchaeota archaeon]
MKFKNKVFVPFLVLGDPDYDTSLKLIKTLIDNGAGALELGFAFSDPIADGPTVQKANNRALANGITTEKSFEILKKVREYSNIPISLLVSANIALQHGLDKFYKRCDEISIEAVLCPDIPLEESKIFMKSAKEHNVEQICIVSLTTSEERMKKLSELYGGYVYLVSLLGTTGVRTNLEQTLQDLIKQTKKYFQVPIYVGFGISTPEHAQKVISYGADGAICGSALCNLIEKNLNNPQAMKEAIGQLCLNMTKAVNS